MKKLLLLCSLFFSFNLIAGSLPLHCEEESGKVSELIGKLKSANIPFGDKLVLAAKSLEGSGVDDYYSRDSLATLRINLESFTPLMFINNVIALVKTAESPGNPDINVFSSQFEDISCRRGENKGFPSIMYHASDWIGDNVARGNVTELTENYAGVVARTKSLDEMTRKREDFAALADSATFETVRMTEMGFRTHRIPSLKKETIKKKEIIEDLENGDIILLVPNRDGIDIYDMGIVSKTEDGVHLIHLSPNDRKIVEEKEDIARYLGLMTKYFQGYRILRVNY